MTKNILVVDEYGTEYGATYLKRAKKLVKQGRARFLAQNMLCLACPPNHNLEDNDMSEQIIENQEIENHIIENHIIENNITERDAEENKFSINYCLEQIEQIANQTEYLNQTISGLHHIEVVGGGDIAGQAKASALCKVVECRETTNQQLLRFYEKMYDDLKNTTSKAEDIKQKAQLQEQLLKIMDKSIENCDYSTNELKDLFNGAFDAIRHLND